MSQTMNPYDTITAESENRERERLCAKARHDEAQALRHAKLEGLNEGRLEEKFNLARVMLSEGESFDKITRYTGLTMDEIAGLRKTD